MRNRFNLLPHRAHNQQWHRRVLARQLSVVLVIAFMSACLVDGVVSLRVRYLEAYNRSLLSAVNQILPEFQEAQRLMKLRDDMLEKQKVLERLDARRSTSVMILNDVAHAIPGDIYLTRLEEDGERFRLEGKSVSSNSIARFFESIVQSESLAGWRWRRFDCRMVNKRYLICSQLMGRCSLRVN